MKPLRQCVWIVCFSLVVGFGYAQFGTRPQIINFSKSEYGASSQNWAMDQDTAGHLFVANNRGLLVYDGAWQLYELPGQQITRSVACDSKGTVYTGAFGEFGYWKKQPLGRYVYHSLNSRIHYPQFAREEIWKILVDGNVIYFQSFSTLYRLQDSTITPISCPGNIMYAFSIRGHLYVQVLHKGLYRLSASAFEPVSLDAIFSSDEVISILDYQGTGLLIGTVHNGFYRLEKGQMRPMDGPINNILKSSQLNAAVAIPGNRFAVGTIQSGIYIIDANGQVMEHFYRENGLQNNTVLALKIDLAGNLWAGLDHGLDEIVLLSPFRYYIDYKGMVGSVYAAALYHGQLYIGSNHGLFVYDPVSAQYRQIPGIKGQVWNLSVWNGQLFCAHNSGTAVISGNNTVEMQYSSTGGWAVKPLGSDPRYAFQGTYTGLAVYRKDAEGHYQYWKIVKGTENVPYSDWVEDAAGNIWLVHAYKGLSRITLDRDKGTVLSSMAIGSSNGLSMKYRQYLFARKGQIYAVSPAGLLQWEPQQRIFSRSKPFWDRWGELTFAKKIILNNNNSVWFIKDGDQLVYGDRANNSNNYFLRDFSLVGGYETILSLDSNYDLLCGENGFALFDHRKALPLTNYQPDISRVSVAHSGQYIDLSHVGTWDDDRWNIHYTDRNLKIIAGIPVYDRKVQYRFYLAKENEAGEWSEWQNVPTRIYNNLLPGNYHIQVQTNINQHTAQFEITVLPPWYRSWWAELLYLIAISLAIRALFLWIEKRHQRAITQKNKEMEEKLVLQQMQHERELLLLQQEKLEKEVQIKSEDLANSASELIKRKKLLSKLFVELEKLKENKENAQMSLGMRKLAKELERQLKLEKDETRLFEQGFNTVHETFFHKLLEKYPQLTPHDLKLAAYLRMNLGSKEIAPLLNITVRGVELKRYRLRKKLDLPEEMNLNEFMMKF